MYYLDDALLIKKKDFLLVSLLYKTHIVAYVHSKETSQYILPVTLYMTSIIILRSPCSTKERQEQYKSVTTVYYVSS
jgi:hypothetical protein